MASITRISRYPEGPRSTLRGVAPDDLGRIQMSQRFTFLEGRDVTLVTSRCKPVDLAELFAFLDAHANEAPTRGGLA